MKNFLLSALLTLMTFSAFAQSVTVNPDPITFGHEAVTITLTIEGAATSAAVDFYSNVDGGTPIFTGSDTDPEWTNIGGGTIISTTFTLTSTDSPNATGADANAPTATNQFFVIFKDAIGNTTGSKVLNAFLPIELKSFDAKNDANNVKLAWTTSTEENNDFFTLERSFDGKEFATVTKVDGAGNSEEEVAYSFSDENVTRIATSNTAYYRLKQTDFDGAFTYSDVISVDLKNRADLEVTNVAVAGNELSVNFVAPTEGATEISVYDLTGRLIATNTEVATEGYNTTNVVLNTNQSGIFIVRITNGQSQTVRKIMK